MHPIMRTSLFLLAITLGLAWFGQVQSASSEIGDCRLQANAQFEGDSYVTTLTPENFNSVVGGDKASPFLPEQLEVSERFRQLILSVALGLLTCSSVRSH
eukprot:1196346-Prorocentrum_minimum.AAC.4